MNLTAAERAALRRRLAAERAALRRRLAAAHPTTEIARRLAAARRRAADQ